MVLTYAFFRIYNIIHIYAARRACFRIGRSSASRKQRRRCARSDIATFRERSVASTAAPSTHLHGNGNPFLISMRGTIENGPHRIDGVLLHRAALLPRSSSARARDFPITILYALSRTNPHVRPGKERSDVHSVARGDVF